VARYRLANKSRQTPRIPQGVGTWPAGGLRPWPIDATLQSTRFLPKPPRDFPLSTNKVCPVMKRVSGEANHGRLGCDIVSKAGSTERAARRYGHDPPARLHASRRLLRRNERPDHIDFQHLPESLFSQIQERSIVVDAGCAHHGVNPGLSFQHCRHRTAIANVADCCGHVQALILQGSHREG